MWVTVGNVSCSVVRYTKEERAWLEAYLTYSNPNAFFNGGPSKLSLFDWKGNRFPTGLLQTIQRKAEAEGITIEVVDGRTDAPVPATSPDLSWLRWYQREAVARVVAKERGILWMPTGCLTGDAKVIIKRNEAAYVIELETLVTALEGGTTHENKGGTRSWDLSVPTYTLSMDAQGYVQHNRIVRGWRNGEAEVFQVTTEGGRTLRATAAHRFRVRDGFVRLDQLRVGDDVCVYEWGPRYKQKLRSEKYAVQPYMVKHPHKTTMSSRRDGMAHTVPVHRLVVEARMNGLSYPEYIGRLVLGQLDGLEFINPHTHHVHHVDRDTQNNDGANLELLTISDHVKVHMAMRDRHPAGFQSGSILLDRIRRIEPAGVQPVFDLELEGPRNNYCPNEFVVHNSGKTEVFCGLEHALPGRWLFIVHRAGLAFQAADRFELRNQGALAGRIGEGKWDADWSQHRVVAATFQSLSRKLADKDPRALALLDGATRLAVDECHVLPADSYRAVCDAMPHARIRVGLSGTPLAREDKRSLVAIATLGPVIYRLRTSTLIDEGVLARPTIRAAICRQEVDALNWEHAYQKGIVRSAARNRMIVAVTKMATKPTMVFVKATEHGKLLARLLEGAGVPCRFVWGTHGDKYRRKAIADLISGEIQAIVCSTIFTEGVDIPELRSVVNAAAGKSVIAALQRVGRGMRKSTGKEDFDVFDIKDEGCGCQDSLDDEVMKHTGCKWLERHSDERLAAYAGEGYTVTTEVLGAATGPRKKT